MQFKMNAKKIILPLVFLFSIHAYANEKLQAANALYESGNCEKAIPAFQAISTSDLDQAGNDKVLFRVSYCQFFLGNYQESEKGFKKYLSTHANEEEANLKYAQSLLYQGKNSEAKTVAQKIKSADFLADAAIVIGRAQMELGEYGNSLNTLRPYLGNPEAIYWSAVASYYADEDSIAEKGFSSASEKADKDSWVKTESLNWLKKIKEDKRKLHVRLTAGFLKDSNIDQSGGSRTGDPGPGGPGSSKAYYANTNYTSAKGGYAALDLIHNTYSSRKTYLTTTLSGSTPFYSGYSNYNLQTASLDFTLKRFETNTFTYGTSLKYADTFYNRVYSQDYIYFTPYASWSFAPDFWLKFSIPVTAYMNSKDIKLYSGNLDLSYDVASWVSFYVGASKLKSSAPETVITASGNGSSTVTSGTIFSHYNTTGAYIGATFYPIDTYQVGLTGSKYTTKYDLERLPPGQRHQAREDKLTAYQVSLTKTFIQNVLSLNLSFSHTKNDSTGYPGIKSNNSVSNNSYTRNYTLLTLEYYY